MRTPKITVYIPCHNYGRFLGDAIESVLRQKREDWELLIIDDNSTDNTRDVMALYKGDGRVRLFHTDGVGLPAVCNLAIAEGRGEYFIRLDGDDVFDENILLVLGEWLDKDSELALIFPDYYLIDEMGEIFAQERREPIARRNYLLDMPPNGACALARKQVLQEIGGYRKDLDAQDGFDLWRKLVNNYKTANINLPLFYYRRHADNLTNNHVRILGARRQVKREHILTSLGTFKPFIAVIPCRQNYDFHPNVWRETIGSLTLLQRSIQTCLASSVLDYVVVASDNVEVVKVMAGFNDKRLRFFQRIPADTIRSKSLVTTFQKIADEYDPDSVGVTVICYLQAPFVTTDTLEEAIFTLVLNHADSSIGVEEIQSPIYKRAAHGLQAVNPPRMLSTDFDRLYREASTALATRNQNLKTGSLTGPTIVNFIVASDECFFINSERTLKIAQLIDEVR